MFRTIAITAACLAITGCAAPADQGSLPGKRTVEITVEEVAHLGGALGTATMRTNAEGVIVACHIKLTKYPRCLQHEIRHCLEGNWHDGKETRMGCFDN